MTKPILKSTENRQDWLFVILGLFTVTFFLYRDFDIRMLFGYALLGLVLLVHLLRRLLADRAPGMDPVRIAFLILSAAVLVNFLRPDSRHDSNSVSFVLSMVICCAFVLLSRTGERAARIGLGVCFGGAVCLTAFVQFFEFNPWYFWNWFLPKLSGTASSYLCYYVPRGYGFSLGGATLTDYVVFVGLSICCGYLASGRKFDWKSALALVLGAVFFETILIVGRRGELLGAAVCLVLLVLVLCGKKQRRILLIGGIAVCVVGFIAIVALLPWLKQFPALSRYVMTVERLLRGQDITSGRLELYALAWDSFLKHPILGIGWDQFHALVPQTFQELHGQSTVEDVHCIYLQFLTETGIVGTVLLVAPLFYLYYQVCAQLTRLKKRPGELCTARMLCITSFLIQSFLLILGLIDPTFQKIVFWCFYGIALMLLCAALELEGYAPDDPVSRLLNKFIHLCAPPFVLVWNWVAGLFRPLRR